MTAPRRQRKGDRLISPGATPDEIRCDFALAPFDKAARDAERVWGIDRLPALVSPETAVKFGSAMAKLNAAIDANDAAEVATRAAVCTRGLAAMDAEARAAGHAPQMPQAWQVDVGGRVCAILSDADLWPAYTAANPGVRTYTLREVGLALEHYGNIVASVKDTFPGAEIAAVRKRTPLEKELDDEIPW